MSRGKKVWIAMLMAVFLVCAAGFSFACAGMLSARAQMTQPATEYTSLTIDAGNLGPQTVYSGHDLENLKPYLTVTAQYAGGSDTLSASEYTLSVQGGGEIAVGENTIVATIEGGTASGTFTVNATAATSQPTDLAVQLYDSEDIFWSTASVEDITREINTAASLVYFGERSEPLVTYAEYFAVKFKNSLLPEIGETESVYQRTVIVEFTYQGKTVSDEIEINVQWNRPDDPEEYKVSGPRALTAGSSATNDEFEITIYYVNDRAQKTLLSSEFTIRYQEGGESNEYVEFGDTVLYIDYVEGGETFTIKYDLSKTPIIERPIDVPLPTQFETALNRYGSNYSASLQTWDFTRYNKSQMEISPEGLTEQDTNPSDSLISFTATDAGTYKVKFTAKDGFQFRSSGIGEEATKINAAGTDIIVSVTYTWVIAKVDLKGVTFALSKDSWTYGEAAAEITNLKASGVGSESSGVALGTASEEGVAVVPVYNYKGTPNEGSSWSAGSSMPADGGTYSVGVSLTGMKNYNDYTMPEESEVSFTILRKAVAVPTAEETSFPYDEYPHSLDITHHDNESLYVTSNELKTNAGSYSATFTLNQEYNYYWEGQKEGEAVYSIAWSIDPSSNSLTLAMDGWTYGEAASALVPTLTFGNTSDIVYTWQYRKFGTQEGEFAECADPREGTPAAGYYRVQGDLAGTGDYKAVKSDWATFTIDRKEVDFPVLTGWESFVYDGSEKSPKVPTNAGYTHSGTTQATDAGDYSVKFTLNDNYRWKGKESEVRTHSDTWTIKRQGVAKPAAVQENTYSGTQYSYKEGSPAYTVTSDGQTDAGKYDVIFRLDKNYCWGEDGSADTSDYTLEGGLVILRSASLTKPTFADAGSTVYDESEQQKTVNGYQSDYMSAKPSSNATFSDGILSATVAGGHTVTFTITSNNYTWKGGETDPTQSQSNVKLTWTIEKAENAVLNSDGESFVGNEYAGWKFGETPTDPTKLNVRAKFDNASLTAEYKYYAASDTGFSTPITMTEKSNVGEYVLRVIIPAGDNTLEAHFDFAFSIEKNESAIQGETEIEDPVLAGKDAWYYKDPLTAHELTYRVMVGATEITEIKDAVVVTYYEGTEGSGTPIEREALAEAGAGKYYVTIVVPETDNYTRAEFTIEFTIQKYAIAIPSFERTNVYQAGSAWNPGIPTTGGEKYRGATWQVAYDNEDSEAVGTYWATLTLVDPANFAWNGDFYSAIVDGDTLSDKFLKEGDTSAVRVWYRITKAPYENMNLTIGGSSSAEWKYGDPHAEVSFNAPTDVESKVTFTITGRTDNEDDDDFKVENQLYSEIGNYWPKDAGKYTLTVMIPTSANFDTCSGSVEFTIQPKVLTPSWDTVVYTYGSVEDAVISFTGFAYEETSVDYSLQYRTESADYSGSGTPVNAGDYTVIVTLGNKNYCFEGSVYSAESPLTFKVNPYTLDVTIENPASPDYTGVPIVPTVSAERIGEDELIFVCTYYKKGGTSVEGEPVDAGAYYVVVTLGTGMENYALEGEKAQGEVYTISPAALKDVSVQEFNDTYKGGEYDILTSIQASAATVADRDKESIQWTFTVEGEKKTELTDAGTYTVNYTVSAPNHLSQSSSVTFTIKQAELTLEANDVSVVYGTEAGAIEWHEGLNGVTVLSGLVGKDEGKAEEVLTGITFAYSAVDYQAGDGVGGKYGVRITNEFDLTNYTVKTQDGVLTVTPLAITVEIDYQSGTYGMTAENMAAQVKSHLREGSALYSEDTESEVWSLSVLTEDRADAPSVSGKPNAGRYYIYGKAESNNYSITFCGQEADGGGYVAKRALFELEKASVTISLEPKESGGDYLVYDGTGKEYTASLRGQPIEIAFTIRYYLTTEGEDTATEELPVNAGNYTVVATITDPTQANNYNIGSGASTKFTISKATYSWVNDVRGGGFNQTSFVYNDTAFAPVLKNAEQITAGADGIEVKVTYRVEEGGEIRNAGTYTYIAEFVVTSQNYNPIPAVSAEITVAQYQITAEDVTWQNGQACSFVYNGKEQSGSVVATYSPFVNGAKTGEPVALIVSVNGSSGFKNVGEYSFTVTDVADDNYTFASNITKDYSITRYAVEIKASDHADVTYGENMPTFAWEGGEFFETVTVTVEGYDIDGNKTKAGTPVGSYVTRIVGLSAQAGVLNNYTINGENGEDWAQSAWLKDETYFGSFKIVAKAISLDGAQMTDAIDRTYDGTAVAAVIDLNTVTGRFGEDTLDFTYAYEGTDVSYSSDAAPTEAGTYTVTVALAAPGGQNANYTMAAKEFTFKISPATIGSVSVEGKTVDYNGQEFRFETGVQGLLNSLSAESVNGQEISWKFSLTKGQFGEGYAREGLTEVNDTDENIETVDEYTVYYQVSAPNHVTVEDFFTVKIDRVANSWNNFYRHDGWAYKGDGTLVNPRFDGISPDAEPKAVFGTNVAYKYYKTRTGDAGSYVYSDEIAEPDTFFNNDTPAGTYYVQVSIAGTKDYKTLTYDGTIVVKKHTLSLQWQHDRLTADDQDTITQNEVVGFNSALMEYVTASGLTVSEEGGRIVADVNYTIGTYSVTIRVRDEANYCWDGDIVDASNPINCVVKFTVSELENKVVITVSSAWMYGDEVTVHVVQGAQPAEGYTISVAASSLQGSSESSAVFGYAADTGISSDEDAASLRYSTEVPTAAGTYWVRVTVTGEEAYGIGVGYAKFTIDVRTLEKPTKMDGTLTYDGSTRTYLPKFAAGFEVSGGNVTYTLPNGRSEIVARIADNSYTNAGSYKAIVTLTDTANYAWEGGGEVSFDWNIQKQKLKAPLFEQSSKNSLTTTYSPLVTSKKLSGFDANIMGILQMENATYAVVDGTPSMVASDAGVHAFTVHIKAAPGTSDVYNYYWEGQDASESGGTVTLTWTVEKFVYTVDDTFKTTYGISFEDAQKEYNGQSQTLSISFADGKSLPAGLSVRYEGSATDVSQGAVEIKAIFFSTSENYAVSAEKNFLSAYLTVTPKNVAKEDIVWTDASFVYTAQSQKGSVRAYFIGVDGSEIDLPVRIQSGQADFLNAGNYTFALDTASFGNTNYTLPADAEKVYEIARSSVSIIIADQSATYNGAAHAATTEADDYTLEGDYYDDFIFTLELLWRGDSGTEDFIGAGNYDIVLSAQSREKLEANYNVTVTKGEFTVEKAVAAVEWDIEDNITYDGTEHSFAATYTDVAGEPQTLIVTIDGGKTFKDAGSYTFIAAFAQGTESDNYVLSESQTHRTVLPAQITVEVVAPDGLVYDGEAGESASFTAEGLLEEDREKGYIVLVYAGTSFAGVPYNAQTAPVAAGNYTVTATLRSDCVNYVFKADSFLTDGYVIAKQGVETPVQEEALYYNAAAQKATFAQSELYTHGEVAEQSNAGTYYVTFTLTDENNYTWNAGSAKELDVEWTILQATAEQFTVEGLTMSGWTYDGTAHTPAGTIVLRFTESGATAELASGAYQYLYASAPDGEFSTAARADAGSYLVRVHILETENYAAANSDSVGYTVAQAAYDLSGISLRDASAVYNGASHTVAVEGTLPVGFDGISVHVTYTYAIDGETYEAMADAGVYTVTAKFVSDSANYSAIGQVLTAKYTITKASAHITWNIGTDLVYDGTEHSFAATYRNVYGEEVAFTVTEKDGKAFQNAGSYTFEAVFATAEESRNYTLDEKETQRTILPRTVSISFGSTEFVYDGTAKYVTAELTDEVALRDGVTVAIAYAGTPFGDRTFAGGADAPVLAGTYTATASLENANGNFVADGAELPFMIAKARVEIPELPSMPYSHTEQTADISDTEFYRVVENAGGTSVGVYEVILTLIDADDYLWYDTAEHDGATQTLHWTITQAQYGKDYTLQNPVYEGEYVYDNTGKLPTQHAKIVFTTSGAFIEGSDDANSLTAPIRYAYAKVASEDATPTTGDFIYDRPVEAGIYKIVAHVPATANYTKGYDLENISTLIIAKAAYDMAGVSLPQDAAFVYDGTAHSPVLQGSLPVGLDGIQAEVAGYTYTKGDSSVSEAVGAGTYTVTVSFSTRSSNYEAPASLSAQFVVEQKTLTAQDVQWESGSYVYNGTDQIESVKAYFTDANGQKVYLAVRIFDYIPAGSDDISITATEFRHAGSYVFVVSNADNENYVFDESADLTLVMAPSEITIELGTARAEYSGTEPADLSGIGVKIGGDYYEEDLQLVLVKERGTGVGTYAVTIGECGNYDYLITNAQYAQGAFVIEPKEISVDLHLNEDLVYDGTEKTGTWSIADSEFVSGEGTEQVTVSLVYSGTANDGTTWYGLQAPVKAGTYLLSVRLSAENYVLSEETQISFTIERAKVALPTLADSGAQSVASVESGEKEQVLLRGFNAIIMGINSDGMAELSFDQDGNISLVAKEIGTYSVSVYLKDTYNYEWAAEEDEDGNPVSEILLSWTLQDAEDSIVWLIVTLSCLLACEIVVLIVMACRGKKNGGGDDAPQDEPPQDESLQSENTTQDEALQSTDTPQEEMMQSTDAPQEETMQSTDAPQDEAMQTADAPQEEVSQSADTPQDGDPPAEGGATPGVKMYSFAALGALLFVPAGQIGAAAALAAACVVAGVCIVVAAMRGKKKDVQEEQAAEPVIEEPVPQQEDVATEELAAEPVIEEPAPQLEEVVAEEQVAEPVIEEPAPQLEDLAAEEQAIAEEEEEDEEEEEEPESFEEEDEEEADMVLPDADLGVKKILVRYIYSFMARLLQSPQEIKARYGAIKDEVQAYEGVKSNISWKQERIYKGRRTIAYILFKGKKLCMAFALDPAAYSETKYRGIDMSGVKRFAKTPMLLKITSERKLRYAVYLLSEACAAAGAEKGEVIRHEYSLPYRTTQELIGENLVKVLTSGDIDEHMQVEEADISALIRDKISMREAHTALTDEVAAMLVEDIDAPQEEGAQVQEKQAESAQGAEESADSVPSAEESVKEEQKPVRTERASAQSPRAAAVGKKKRGIVNIDSLSRAFAPNDVVNLATLRAKGILNPKADGVKVLARGVLDKPLIVEADDFSMDAVKMILLTGGKVRRIRSQK